MIERARVEAVLNRFRPLLQSDGVDIELVDVRGDGASIRIVGLCTECHGAPLNWHTGLTEILREEIPELGELRLV
jgi:Fe-S cluster biogenesis protein NfuA